MSEEILKALMQLFAIIAKVNKDGDIGLSKSIVRSYLRQYLNKKLQNKYLDLFEDFLKVHHAGTSESTKTRKRTSANSVKVLTICNQINEYLEQSQKVLVLIQLLEFIRNGTEITEKELDFVATVAETFNVSDNEYENIYSFIFDKIEEMPEKANYLAVDSEKANEETKNITRDGIEGVIHFLYIQSTNMYAFKYIGTSDLYLNGINIPIDRTQIFDKGSSIRSPKIKPIYYSDIVSKFLYSEFTSKIVFSAKDVQFFFHNSDNGIQTFNFSEESGELIGIMGGSGVGKSTLLNVLNGNLKPQQGTISINGFDIHKDKEKVRGIIGFVPQDDLLVEELSVYQNLYFNAKLCFADYNETQIETAVNKVLMDLDLFEIKDLTVGSPLNKFISGGQRKRLNIALELIREPSIMFVDEPTSGLSSMDSEMVMDLLKEQTLKGNLVIVNIHQPSSDIFKMFDKLLIMDKGGYLIYYGNPIESISYFKKQSNFINAEDSECTQCGNVNPEHILQIIETKFVDEYGKLTRNRKVSAKEWHEIFLSESRSKNSMLQEDYPLPANNFKLPGKLEQFKIFLYRNILSKLTNKQYILISLLEAPALAFILAFLSKYIAGATNNPDLYIFRMNDNIPSYLFMMVVCALFIGLTISAEEIIKDKKILQRERFLNLSKVSYLNSKVVLLFVISAIQTISFILLGNWILEIKNLTGSYFLIIFSTACFANMLGLNISASLNSVVTIYISIPFILVPQLLLSGVIVKFDKLHKSIANYQYVSVIGDMMTSRWAYEALAVNQFCNNDYQNKFVETERKMSDAAFKKSFLVPELESVLNYCKTNRNIDSLKPELSRKFKLINDEISLLCNKYGYTYKPTVALSVKTFTPKNYQYTLDFLEKIKGDFIKKYNYFYSKRDKLNDSLLVALGKDKTIELKNDYYNDALADQVLNNLELNKIVEKNGQLVQNMEPIYKSADHNFGRAHFYASQKTFLGNKYSTVWFNIIVMWLMTATLYLMLLGNTFSKIITMFDSFKITKRLKKNR